jgi:cysteine synthase A
VAGSIRESEKIAAQVGGYLPRQFSNPDNPLAQEHGSGREILEQMAERGPIGAVVSGVGTGGTLVGLFSALRTIHPEVIPVLARPVEITETPETECCSFSSQIPGVVEGVSDIFRRADLPGLLTIEVREEQAIDTARRLIARGYPVGPSSGLNYVAALEAARLVRGAVVTVFPDRMERYFTTRMFEPFRTELAASVG